MAATWLLLCALRGQQALPGLYRPAQLLLCTGVYYVPPLKALTSPWCGLVTSQRPLAGLRANPAAFFANYGVNILALMVAQVGGCRGGLRAAPPAVCAVPGLRTHCSQVHNAAEAVQNSAAHFSAPMCSLSIWASRGVQGIGLLIGILVPNPKSSLTVASITMLTMVLTGGLVGWWVGGWARGAGRWPGAYWRLTAPAYVCYARPHGVGMHRVGSSRHVCLIAMEGDYGSHVKS